MAEPIRTCVGCRTRRAQRELLRFVAEDAAGASGVRLRSDPLRRAAGRGVYTCPRPECVSRAVLRGGFSRGFRRSFRVDEQLLLDEVRSVLSGSVEALSAQLRSDGRVDTKTLRELLAWRAAFGTRLIDGVEGSERE